ncbi:MAG TPA: phosphoribosyltransferase [Pseudomonadales bacterium]
MNRFADRKDAGFRLAAALGAYANRLDVIVLALPRGGVPVAHEVARVLNAPLDVWIVRKIGVPGHEELAMGAIALGDQQYLDRSLIARLGVSDGAVQRVVAREAEELQRRNRQYRNARPLPQLDGQTVILVDDGLATGASMRVAVQSVRNAGAREIVVAVPVGPASTCAGLAELAIKVVCPWQPEPFQGVGQWYDDFTQTGDDEVRTLLAQQPWMDQRRRAGADV